MSDHPVHTVPGEGRWFNEVAARQIGERYATRDEAVAEGRAEALARHVEHHIHDEHGLVDRTESYTVDQAESCSAVQ
ncbi:DUF2188 domain-containing protein [Cellulomonas sp. URHE0023]|uniref:DUF2188 domain-containing protein n=1 Tax=Cellulomonas sp. URHE0023 TaxID=1380354 RepID=UPI0004816884|nr:DUF2188 domain-containing protein [Cellulomonas sp. URHE0023]